MRSLIFALSLLTIVPAHADAVANAPQHVEAVQEAGNDKTADPNLRIAAAAGDPVATISLEQKIGQMILVGFLGSSPGDDWVKTVRGQLEKSQITGVMYLKRNIRNRAQVANLNAMLQLSAKGLQPLIAIDQEGGRIERLTPAVGFPHTPSAANVSAKLTPLQAHEAYEEMAANLHRWGFNLNLGPVVDLNINPSNPIIGRLGRSFSDDPARVVQYATAFVDAHRKNGVLTALKHFPGHGSSTNDSHKGAVDVSKSWKPAEMDAFAMLVQDRHADIIMSAHVRNAQIQDKGDTAPVSLSRSGLYDNLRTKLKFSGVIMSDDLQMSAVSDNYSLKERVIRAVKAGNDILIFANDKNPDIDIPTKVIGILAAAAKQDSMVANAIANSYQRIVALKQRLANRAADVDPLKTRAIARSGQSMRPVLSAELMQASAREVRLVIP